MDRQTKEKRTLFTACTVPLEFTKQRELHKSNGHYKCEGTLMVAIADVKYSCSCPCHDPKWLTQMGREHAQQVVTAKGDILEDKRR